jgi:hypothetical protein
MRGLLLAIVLLGTVLAIQLESGTPLLLAQLAELKA